MGKSWKELFTFSRKEQGGITVLLILFLGLILLYPLVPRLVKKDQYESSEFIQQAERFMKEMEKRDSLAKLTKINTINKHSEQDNLSVFLAKPFIFDPNTASEEILVAAGLNKYTAKNIVKYCRKGGYFNTTADLEKIYGMDKRWLEAASPFIKIVKQPDKEAGKEMKEAGPVRPGENVSGEKGIAEVKQETLLIDLNKADTGDLMRCTGIGTSYARRIIAYRELLGGYYSKDQLLEVYGMDSVRYMMFQNEIEIKPNSVIKMDLNRVEFKEMLHHPYFEYYIVKAILDYGKSKKGYDSLTELMYLPEIYPELYDKISPYLEVVKKNHENE